MLRCVTLPRAARRLLTAPAGLPAPLAWVFWADATVLVALLAARTGAAFRGAGPPPVLLAADLVALFGCWWGLPRQVPVPGVRRQPVLPPAFLVVSLGLGPTGTSGEQLPIILVAFAVLAASWGTRGTVVAAVALAATMCASDLCLYHVAPMTSLVRGLLFCAAQGMVLCLVQAITRARQAQERAEGLAARVRDLTVSQERGRLAAAMHDTVGQQLMVVSLDLENALRLWDRDRAGAREQVVQAREDVATAVRDVRRAVRAVRPLDLAGRRLSDTLRDLASCFERTGLAVAVAVDADADGLPAQQQAMIVRAVQEGLLNTVRHSGADRVAVSLECGDDVRLTVVDNGCGADDDRLAHGFGLRELSAGARIQRGRLHLDGRQGVRMVLSLPLGVAS